jgi:hypothetical protein
MVSLDGSGHTFLIWYKKEYHPPSYLVRDFSFFTMSEI